MNQRVTTFGLVLILAATGLAEASARDKLVNKTGGTGITACSRYGNGCISGAVRASRYGHEVQLKSGTWIDCRQDCERALLEETVDFWDSQADKARIAAP